MNKPNKKIVNEEWEGDDDCEICKVMKKGLGGNYGDLAEAFAKQNIKNEKEFKENKK